MTPPLLISFTSLLSGPERKEKNFLYLSITLFLPSSLHPERMDGCAGSLDEEERGGLTYVSPYHSISEGEALGYGGREPARTHSKGKSPLSVVRSPSLPN